MSTARHSLRWHVWRTIRTVVLWGVCVSGALLFYAHAVGIPDCLVRHILSRVNRGSFAVDIGSAKLSGIMHVNVDRATIYRKRVLGPPMLETGTVRVRLAPLAWFQGCSAIDDIVVDDVIWRPLQGRSQHRHPPGLIRRPLDFSAEIRNCQVHGVTLNSIRFSAVGHGQLLQVDDLSVSLQRSEKEGRLGGGLAYDLATRTLSGRLVTNVDPHIMTPLMDLYEMNYPLELVNRFNCDGAAPRGEFVFDRRMGVKGDIHLTGDFRIRDCSYRGVGLLRADGALTIDRRGDNYKVSVNNLFVVRREGMANVAFSVYPREKLVEFTAESTIAPLAMARMVGVLTNITPQHIEIQGASTIEASGRVDVNDSYAQTDFWAKVQADRIRVHEMTCDSGAVDLHMVGRSVTLTNFEASVYGGIASGHVVLEIPPRGESNSHYRASLNFEKADFESFMKAVTPPESKNAYQGELSGGLQIEGDSAGAFLKSINGVGSVHVRDGRVFLLPVFGGLSRLMTKIIPGLDFVLRQSDAKSEFEINDGVLTTEKVAVEGGILSLKGHGSYRLGDELDFDIQVKLMKEHTLVAKLLRVLTYPISKLFEFRLRGTLSEPVWYPVNFSMDLLERVGFKKREANTPSPPEPVIELEDDTSL